MMDDKKVSQITFKEIIEGKRKFILENNIFDKEEYKNTNDGEILAYNQILKDIEELQVQSFEAKYIEILKDIDQKLDMGFIKDNNEVEKIAGYNNAIVSVLKLINPIYEYKLQ